MSIMSPVDSRWTASAADQRAGGDNVRVLRPHIEEMELHAFVDDQLHPAARDRVHAYLAQHPEQLERLVAVHRQKLVLRVLFARPAAPMPISLACLGHALERSISLSLACRFVFKAMLLVAGLSAVGLLLWSAYD